MNFISNNLSTWQLDTLSISVLEKYFASAKISSELKSQILEHLKDNLDVFGRLKGIERIPFKSIDNGSRQNISRNGGVYRGITKIFLKDNEIEISEIHKIYDKKIDLERTISIEKSCEEIGIADLVTVHTERIGKRLVYLFEGEDLRNKLDGLSNDDDKKKLVKTFFLKHLEFARKASNKEGVFDRNYIYTNSDHADILRTRFFERLGTSEDDNLEEILQRYNIKVAENLDKLTHYIQHADPKLSNAVEDDLGDVKLIDLEAVADAPIHKLFYWICERQGTNLEELCSFADESKLFAELDFFSDKFKKDYKNNEIHEDLLNVARNYEFSNHGIKSKKDKYLDVANFYFNRALRTLNDQTLEELLNNKVSGISAKKIERVNDEKFEELLESINLEDKQWSRSFPSEIYETPAEKFDALKRSRKRGMAMFAGLGVVVSLGLSFGLYEGWSKYNEARTKIFNWEIDQLKINWNRENGSLKTRLNPCEYIKGSSYLNETYLEKLKQYDGNKTLALVAIYGADNIINKFEEQFGKWKKLANIGIVGNIPHMSHMPNNYSWITLNNKAENEYNSQIINYLPPLLKQQIIALDMAEFSNGKAYYDNFMYMSYQSGVLPLITRNEMSRIHREFPCLTRKE